MSDVLIHPAATMAAHAGPVHAVVLGGGDGLGIRELLRHPYFTSAYTAEGWWRHFLRQRERPAGDLVAELPHRVDGRADEFDVARPADLGEMRVFREKTVAGVNRVGVGDLGGGDQACDVEV